MTAPPLVVIGASAGGVEALRVLVGGLPVDLPAAVCIVLHVPPHSPSRLAEVLQRVCKLPVTAADDGEVLTSGKVYTASADRHLMVDGATLRLTRGPKESRARPAIDVLFRSAAVSCGQRLVGVVLTGMLDDGTAGLWAIKDRGGRALVQSPESAEYPSMPESASKLVQIDASLPIEALAVEIERQVRDLPALDAGLPAPTSMKIEMTVAAEGNGLNAGVMRLGKVSEYTCPDCHAVQMQVDEGAVTRFRCHTGHAVSIKTLLADVNESIDTALWEALRAVEERILLLRHMGRLAQASDDAQTCAECERQAADAAERSESLRALVLDPKLFGHTPRSGD